MTQSEHSVPAPRQPIDDWLTPQELADWLKIPVSTIYKWRGRDDRPTGVRVGKHLRYRHTEVEAWLADQERLEREPVVMVARRRAPKRRQ